MVDAVALTVGLTTGAVAGSASAAALVRWPAGEDLRSPSRSHCRGCGRQLRVLELVPVASWLVLRGRCRTCGRRIGSRVLLVEGGTAVAVGATLALHGLTLEAILLAVAAAALVLAAATDLAHRVIPDRLTRRLALGAAAPVLAAALVQGRLMVVLATTVGVPAVLVVLDSDLIRRGRPSGIGGGDIKLLVPVIALNAAVPHALPTFAIAVAAIGLVSVGALMLLGRLRRGDSIPLAPILLAGQVVTILLTLEPAVSAGGIGR